MAKIKRTISSSSFLGPVALFRLAWDYYQIRFGVYVGISFLATVPVIAIAVIPYGNAQSITLQAVVLDLVFGIVSYAISLIGGFAMLYALKDTAKKFGVFGYYRQALQNIWPLLWVSIAFGLAVTGGYMFFFIPGIILSIAFGFGTYVVVNEPHRGLAALLKSRDYVFGHWFEVLLRGLFLAIVAIPMFLVFLLLSAVIPKPYNGTMFTALLQIFWVPLATIYSYTMYLNLKALFESSNTKPREYARGWYVALIIFGALIAIGVAALFGYYALHPELINPLVPAK